MTPRTAGPPRSAMARSNATQRTDLDAMRTGFPPRFAAATMASTLCSSASRSTAASGRGSSFRASR